MRMIWVGKKTLTRHDGDILRKASKSKKNHGKCEMVLMLINPP